MLLSIFIYRLWLVTITEKSKNKHRERHPICLLLYYLASLHFISDPSTFLSLLLPLPDLPLFVSLRSDLRRRGVTFLLALSQPSTWPILTMLEWMLFRDDSCLRTSEKFDSFCSIFELGLVSLRNPNLGFSYRDGIFSYTQNLSRMWQNPGESLSWDSLCF